MSQASGAAQVLIAIVPIVGIVMGGVVAFFYLLWSHGERRLMIERGLYEPARFDLNTFSLLSGILLTAVGLILSVVFIGVAGFGYAMLGGLVPLGLGIGLLAFYGARARERA